MNPEEIGKYFPEIIVGIGLTSVVGWAIYSWYNNELEKFKPPSVSKEQFDYTLATSKRIDQYADFIEHGEHEKAAKLRDDMSEAELAIIYQYHTTRLNKKKINSV